MFNTVLVRGIQMEPEELKKYVNFMKENGLTYLEIRKGDFYLILQTENNGSIIGPVKRMHQQQAENSTSAVQTSDEQNLVSVKSPLIGTFYRAPSPHAPPFVEVDTVVKKGATLCIVEAMKVMNEIKSECTGRVKKILVENGSPVEYGQKLFLLEPLPEQ